MKSAKSRARQASEDMQMVEADTTQEAVEADAGPVDAGAADVPDPFEELATVAIEQGGLGDNEHPEALLLSGTEDLSDMLSVELPVDVLETEAEDVEQDDIPFRFRPGERLFERLSGSYSAAVEEPEPV